MRYQHRWKPKPTTQDLRLLPKGDQFELLRGREVVFTGTLRQVMEWIESQPEARTKGTY